MEKKNGWSPEKGSRLFGDSHVKGTPEVKGTNLFGSESSKVKGTNLFGSESPEVKGTNLFGSDNSPAFNTPQKAGSRKRGKSKKNRRPKLTRRR